MNTSPGSSSMASQHGGGYHHLPPPHRSPLNGRMPEPWHHPDGPRANYPPPEPWNQDHRDHRARSIHHPTPTPPPMNGMDGYAGSSPQALHPRGHRKSLSREAFLPPPLPPTMGRADERDSAAMRYEPVNGAKGGYQHGGGHPRMTPPLPHQQHQPHQMRDPREWEHKRKRSDEFDGYGPAVGPPPQVDRGDWGPYGPPPPGYQHHNPRVWHHYQQQQQQQQHHQQHQQHQQQQHHQALMHEEEMMRRRHQDAEMMRPPAQKKSAAPANRKTKDPDEIKAKKASAKAASAPRRVDQQPQAPPAAYPAQYSAMNGQAEDVAYPGARPADGRPLKEEPRRIAELSDGIPGRQDGRNTQYPEKQWSKEQAEPERKEKKKPVRSSEPRIPLASQTQQQTAAPVQSSHTTTHPSAASAAAPPSRPLVPPPAEHPTIQAVENDARYNTVAQEQALERLAPALSVRQESLPERHTLLVHPRHRVISDAVWQWFDEFSSTEEGGNEGSAKHMGTWIYDGSRQPLLPLDLLARNVGALLEVRISGELLGPYREQSDAFATHGWTVGWRGRHWGVEAPKQGRSLNSLDVKKLPNPFWQQRSLVERKIWGSDVYTDDSDVLAMCIHSGWIEGPAKVSGPSASISEAEADEHKYSSPPDVRVILRVGPQLQAYQESFGCGLASRNWLGRHDGVSLLVERVTLEGAGFADAALLPGSRGLKQGIEKVNVLKKKLEALSNLDDALSAGDGADAKAILPIASLNHRKKSVFPLSEARELAKASSAVAGDGVSSQVPHRKADWWRIDHLIPKHRLIVTKS